MTTLAYRDGVLAADSLTSMDGTRLSCARVDKLFRLTNTRVIGISGTYAQARRLLAWIAAGEIGARPHLPEAHALEANADRAGGYQLRVHDPHGSYPLEDAAFYSIGSGHYYALGAMAAGADARKSVQIACEFDESSGGDVVSMRVVGSQLDLILDRVLKGK